MQLLGPVLLAMTTSAVLQQALCMIGAEDELVIKVGKPGQMAVDQAAQVSEAGAPAIRYPERTSPSEAYYVLIPEENSAGHTGAATQDSPPGAHHTSAHPAHGTSTADGATTSGRETSAPRDNPTRAAIIKRKQLGHTVQTLGTGIVAGLVAALTYHSKPEGLTGPEAHFYDLMCFVITYYYTIFASEMIGGRFKLRHYD